MIGPDPDTIYTYVWNPDKKHYRSALGIVSRSALPAERWTRVGAALISQLDDIERGSNGVTVEQLRWMLAAWLARCMWIWSRARNRAIREYKITVKILKK